MKSKNLAVERWGTLSVKDHLETHAFGFRLPANAPEGQKRFPISFIVASGGPHARGY
jgi:hypothetical protein